jgi:hypothetical protein
MRFRFGEDLKFIANGRISFRTEDESSNCEDLKFETLLFFWKGMGFRFRLDFKFKSLIFLVGWDSDSSEIYNSGRTRRFFFAV